MLTNLCVRQKRNEYIYFKPCLLVNCNNLHFCSDFNLIIYFNFILYKTITTIQAVQSCPHNCYIRKQTKSEPFLQMFTNLIFLQPVMGLSEPPKQRLTL